MTSAVVVREESRALTPAQQRTESIRSAMTARLPAILPNGMSVDRFQAVVMQAIAKNPTLAECDPTSVVMSALEAAQLGLEPTGSLSRAWLIPYKGQATLMIGYQGLVDLARRSGEVSKVVARVVYDGDGFEVEYGSEERIVHHPALETTDPAKVTHVYAIAWLRDGSTVFDVMTRAQVDLIRSRSRSANSGPWVSDYAEMARKTVVRRLVKSLPLTVEAMDAINRDDEREFSHREAAQEPSRTSAVRERLAARVQPAPALPEPAQDAPGAPEPAVAAPEPVPAASAPQQLETQAEAREICGAASDASLGEVEYCVLEPGHANGSRLTPHKSDAGSIWPNKRSAK